MVKKASSAYLIAEKIIMASFEKILNVLYVKMSFLTLGSLTVIRATVYTIALWLRAFKLTELKRPNKVILTHGTGLRPNIVFKVAVKDSMLLQLLVG